MTEKEFVPYHLALRMKQLEFDEPCFGFYYKKENNLFESCKIQERRNSFYVKNYMDKEDCVAPTFSQAFRWFRENHICDVKIEEMRPVGHSERRGYKICIHIAENMIFPWEISKKPFKTYEEAELACLEKLIEIVEQKEK